MVPLSCDSVSVSVLEKFVADRVGVGAHVDDVEVVPSIRLGLAETGVVMSDAKTFAWPAPGSALTEGKISIPMGVGHGIAHGEGYTVVEMPVGADSFAAHPVAKVATDRDPGPFTRPLARILDQ